MSVNQYIRLYDFFKQNFNVDEAKARVFADKSEVVQLKHEVELSRLEMKTGFAELESKMKTEFNKQLIWLVGVMFTLAGVIIAVIKLLF